MTRSIQSRLVLDVSPFITLITCLECSSWRETRATRAGALAAGAIHLKATHGDANAARKVQYLATRGHVRG